MQIEQSKNAICEVSSLPVSRGMTKYLQRSRSSEDP